VALAILLVVAYGLYIRQTIKSGGEGIEETPENLTLWPSTSEAPTWAVLAQVVGTIALMGAGAHFLWAP
jgi:hypothetical protein